MTQELESTELSRAREDVPAARGHDSTVLRKGDDVTVEKGAAADEAKNPIQQKKTRRSRFRWLGMVLLALVLILGIARLMLPASIRWYVNRTIDQNPLYDGEIGGVRVHLWRGAYSIENIRLNKTTGNVPVPLFAAKRLDLAVEWEALLAGRVAGRIVMVEPELNFVDANESGSDQTGAGGPWLSMLSDLFPFKINSAAIENGSIRFRAVDTDPPVDLHLSELQAQVSNLTNIHDETTPLLSTVTASALAMDHARLTYEMKFDPFSYRPTFKTAVKLIGLDVTKTNDLARAYGQFDFEHGWFDLVVELKASEGRMEGYVKPLFRNLKVFSLKKDIREDNVLGVFWEALVGTVSEVLENQPRDQFGTMIALRGDLDDPRMNIMEILGNVLRNAFIRAYLPRLEGVTPEAGGIEFAPGSVTDPGAAGSVP